MRPLIVAALSIGLLIAGGPTASAAPPGYPPLRWLPAAAENFAAGRAGATIGTVVIHATEGTYAGAISWFRDPAAKVSAHYVIRAADGEITQVVAEADTAFHVRGSNRSSIGIEHEFDPDHGQGYTDALYRSSASLVCAITRRYGIPADRSHIRGHSEMPRTDHTDPGPSWDWVRYMSFVSACAGPSASTAPADRPVLVFGDRSPAVTELQRDLGRRGYLGTISGYFGPATREAVRRFQRDHGIPTTGNYGPLTRAAMARAR